MRASTPGSFVSGSGGGESQEVPNRFVPCMGHTIQKGKEASLEQLVRQIRARSSQRRQKPRQNKCYGLYKDKQKKQTPAVKPTDETKSLSSVRFSAFWPPFFWHCSPLEPSVLCMKLRGTSPMDTFLETRHCKWHFRVSKLVLSAGGSNVPSWQETATPTIIETNST